jgi:tartrate-resistant acid phosphatase type 5
MRAGVALLATALAALLTAGAAAGAVRLMAVGDFGVGGTAQERTGEAIRSFEATHPARMLVTLGDNDYTGSPASFERNWQSSFGWLGASGVRVAGVLGNHDVEVDGGRYELRALGMPSAYYTRRVGPVELFLLDSNHIDDTQTAWLERRLSASGAPWKVAVLHHPPFACGGHLGSLRVLDRWVPLFERHGVQLVLSGHDHSYQRFASRNGVTYLIHGGGGAPLYPIVGCLYPLTPGLVFSRSAHGFLAVVAGTRRLTVTALDLRLRRVDRVTLTR